MNTLPSTGHTKAIHGFDMYYEVHGEGHPLLLLHGFTGASADWAHVFDLDELARDHQIILPDLRGHGRSTNPSGAFTHRQCALDVLALLDALGVERVMAVGLSLGGNTLLHMATQQPSRVEAMVLVSATMYFPEQARQIMRQFAVESRSAEEWEIMRARHKHGDDQIRALWRHANGFADSHDDMCFTAASLSTITARTLIVNGDRDPLYPVEISVEMFRAIPRACLWIVPNAGHGPIFGDERPQFARTALGFLREERRAPPPRDGSGRP